jgi:hypothetical protein
MLRKRTCGKEALIIDYIDSHLSHPKKNLVVLKQKEMDKEVVNEFKEFQAKEIEEKDPNEPKIHLLKLSKWFKRSLKNMI